MSTDPAAHTGLPPTLTDLLRAFQEVAELAQRTGRATEGPGLSETVINHLGSEWPILPEESYRFHAVRADEVWSALTAVLDIRDDGPEVQGLGDEHFGSLGSLRALVHQDRAYPSFGLTGPTYSTLTFPDGSSVRTPEHALVSATREGNVQMVFFVPALEGRKGVLTVLGEGAASTIAAVRETLDSTSLFAGQVVELHIDDSDFSEMRTSITVLPRPEVPADRIVLPEGLLRRVTDHVHGIHDAAQRLRDAGQHLRRGVLLYGPPGTGKTLMIRHLMSRPDVTVVVLHSLENGQIRSAMDLARSAQPALLVIEDTDLLLTEDPRSLEMHALLEELDGLGGDADIAVMLTTNDPSALLPSLNHRPGRIDLQIEVPLPQVEARRQLFALYGEPLALPAEALTAAAEATEGASGAWIREVVRREVLAADRAGRAPSQEGLLACIEEMRQDDESVHAAGDDGELELELDEDDLFG